MSVLLGIAISLVVKIDKRISYYFFSINIEINITPYSLKERKLGSSCQPHLCFSYFDLHFLHRVHSSIIASASPGVTALPTQHPAGIKPGWMAVPRVRAFTVHDISNLHRKRKRATCFPSLSHDGGSSVLEYP